MIADVVRRGIKIACINEDMSIAKASEQAGVSQASIYRFMRGNCDIKMLTLDKFFRLGLSCTFKEILELGER